jgi:hypothetical protein
MPRVGVGCVTAWRPHGDGALIPAPVGEHAHAGGDEGRAGWRVGRAGGEEGAQCSAPAEVGESGEGAAFGGALFGGDATAMIGQECLAPHEMRRLH